MHGSLSSEQAAAQLPGRLGLCVAYIHHCPVEAPTVLLSRLNRVIHVLNTT